MFLGQPSQKLILNNRQNFGRSCGSRASATKTCCPLPYSAGAKGFTRCNLLCARRNFVTMSEFEFSSIAGREGIDWGATRRGVVVNS